MEINVIDPIRSDLWCKFLSYDDVSKRIINAFNLFNTSTTAVSLLITSPLQLVVAAYDTKARFRSGRPLVVDKILCSVIG